MPLSFSLDKAIDLLKLPEGFRALEPFLPSHAGSKSPSAVLMHEAIKLPNPWQAKASVAALLKSSPDWANARDPKTGDTALMTAMSHGRLDIADLLLSMGADPKASNREKRNALDAAVSYSDNPRIQEVVVQTVLESCAFTRTQKSFALALATDCSHLGAVRALLKAGADGSVCVSGLTGIEQGNALVVACSRLEDEDEHVLAIVDALLAAPAVRATVDHGWENEDFGAPIHNAAYMGNDRILAKLLDAGARVDVPEGQEGARTPLMAAAFSGSAPDIMTRLIQAGADVNAVDAAGRTALHHLASGEDGLDADDEFASHSACAAVLLKAGANAAARDGDGETPADVARAHDRPDLANLLDAAAGLTTGSPAKPSRSRRQAA